MVELATETFLFLVAIAAVAGFIDAIAGGGGLLTLPALLGAGVPPVMALGTNKVQSSFGAATATYTFWRSGHVDLARMAWPVLASLLGAALGGLVVQRIDPSFLAGLVPGLLIVIALYFLLSPAMSEVDLRHRIEIPAYSAVAAAIGFYDGFFGPGTGSFFTISLISLLGFGLIRATANTKLLNFASNIGALIVMTAGGHIYWTLGLAMAGASIVGGRLGSMTAIRFGGKLIRPLLVVMSVGMTIRLLADPKNPIAQMLWAG
ncbi:TSUP family transporter [Sphingomonas sp. LaA6.9]|uniref:TSUP family transporter n=1 Tax=Sphingomonas sp. LaA6.9 TaxID=2919914 RepID=UPI001F500DA2|nr:TSUP family transporter [Sphingomonas sp. LaA6.9]MCJ8158803.1 TSUP family transporter [Sphingomonas sp. LaA6.9]